MTREEAIKTIETLYPADSQEFTTQIMGQSLLERARREVFNWRNEPTAVLVRYAELCVEEDRK